MRNLPDMSCPLAFRLAWPPHLDQIRQRRRGSAEPAVRPLAWTLRSVFVGRQALCGLRDPVALLNPMIAIAASRHITPATKKAGR